MATINFWHSECTKCGKKFEGEGVCEECFSGSLTSEKTWNQKKHTSQGTHPDNDPKALDSDFWERVKDKAKAISVREAVKRDLRAGDYNG